MVEWDPEKMRKLQATEKKVGRIRNPTSFEIGQFRKGLGPLLERVRPKVPLMLAIRQLVESPEFSWFAASGVCTIVLPKSGQRCGSEARLELAESSLEFLFRIARLSPQNAGRAARLLRGFEGCDADHLLEFFKLLNSLVDRDPVLALHILGAYSCGPRLLPRYTETVSIVLKKGGDMSAREFAAVFANVAAFPESVAMLLDTIRSAAAVLNVKDWGQFMASLSEDWQRTLSSDVFLDHPPD